MNSPNQYFLNLQEKGIKYAMSSKKINQDAITLYILEKYWLTLFLDMVPYFFKKPCCYTTF
ncbi:hypothetical protein [uncultured Gammaproteobacteria bacterium]|nr:hypothetical protein [uncultured Gammaproteobacteria bacterium]